MTSGLVVHHFGNKDGLRNAVQRYVVDQFRRAVDSVPPVGTAEQIGEARDRAVARMWEDNPIFVRYLRRAVLEDTGESELLDLLADYTFGQLQELRSAGIASSAQPAQTQAVGILLREWGPESCSRWSTTSGSGSIPTDRMPSRRNSKSDFTIDAAMTSGTVPAYAGSGGLRTRPTQPGQPAVQAIPIDTDGPRPVDCWAGR